MGWQGFPAGACPLSLTDLWGRGNVKPADVGFFYSASVPGGSEGSGEQGFDDQSPGARGNCGGGHGQVPFQHEALVFVHDNVDHRP
jgi:hypothetical protein